MNKLITGLLFLVLAIDHASMTLRMDRLQDNFCTNAIHNSQILPEICHKKKG